MLESVNQLIEYLNSNKLSPSTPMFNVTVKEGLTPADIDNMQIDIYIGVS